MRTLTNPRFIAGVLVAFSLCFSVVLGLILHETRDFPDMHIQRKIVGYGTVLIGTFLALYMQSCAYELVRVTDRFAQILTGLTTLVLIAILAFARI